MGLYNTIKFDETLPISFYDDLYEWNLQMRDKYSKSKIKSKLGQILSRDKLFCKNASIFDLIGTKIWWGDLGQKDVEDLKGVYYILSEHKSFWNVPKDVIKDAKYNEDPFSKSPFRDYLPLEPILIDIKYIKSNAIARIVDGKIQTSEKLIHRNFQ